MFTKPWLDNYDPDVPSSLKPYPEQTLVDVLAENARLRPEHIAIHFQGYELTWPQFDQQCDAFAAALDTLGVIKGDRVALLLPNSPQQLICQFGAWKVGAIVVPLNPFYSAEELTHALNDTGAETVVVLTPFYEKVKALQPDTWLRNVIAANIKTCLPWPKRILFSLFRERKEGHRVELQPGDMTLCDVLADHVGMNSRYKVQPDDTALLLFTGGTTGKPKAAMSTHQALVMSGMQLYAWAASLTEPWVDKTLLYMPMFHTYGNVGVLSMAVIGRTTLVPVPNPRDLDDLIATIDKVRPQYLCGVPTLFIALLQHPDVKAGKADFSSIKLCLSGASALLKDTKDKFEALTGGRIVEGYALTESVMATVATPVNGVYKPGSVGMPLPDVVVRIDDVDSGDDLTGTGEVGEILLCAPQLMVGYWNDPVATADMFKAGWLRTGDLGYLDADGYLYMVDRQKDVIKPSGFQVWPREVEEVLTAHPAVAEVGVAGVPDPVQGEAVKAWVVLEDGESVSAEALRAHCKLHLAAYKVPRLYKFVPDLPKSTIGKVLRRELSASESA